jgi:hypothetical protein
MAGDDLTTFERDCRHEPMAEDDNEDREDTNEVDDTIS